MIPHSRKQNMFGRISGKKRNIVRLVRFSSAKSSMIPIKNQKIAVLRKKQRRCFTDYSPKTT